MMKQKKIHVISTSYSVNSTDYGLSIDNLNDDMNMNPTFNKTCETIYGLSQGNETCDLMKDKKKK